jgi:sulfide:quinone oxidoreductase
VLLTSNGTVPADRVVALPRVEGPRVPGLPTDAAGFIPADAYGLVDTTADVYAAGDVTTYPVKQGGLATQQADAVAEAIAARAGVPIDPKPFAPRLAGVLLTGGTPLRLAESEAPAPATPSEVWTSKVTGRNLSAWLEARARSSRAA